MNNRAALIAIADKLNEQNEERHAGVVGYVVGPTEPKKYYEFYNLVKKGKGAISHYEGDPWDELAIYRVTVANPHIVDAEFRLSVHDV